MSFGWSSKELEKFQNRIINTQNIRFKKFKKWSTKHYSKIGPQTLLKNWFTNVTKKIVPQTLIKTES